MRLPIGWAVGIGVLAISALAYRHLQGDNGNNIEQDILLPAIKSEVFSDAKISTDTQVGQIESSQINKDQELEGTEIVHGIRVRKDRNCTVQLRYVEKPDGTLIEAYSCEPNEPKEQDIYKTYTNQTLATLAYSDAHAAHVLSKRIHETDPENALKLAIQSTAMSGDTMPINWLAQHYTQPSKRNGEVILKTIEDRYVMSGVIKELNGLHHGYEFWTQRIRFHEKDGINIEALDKRVDNILAEVDRLRELLGTD